MQEGPSSLAVVTKLSSLLEQGPIHFEITILPGLSSSSANDEDDEDPKKSPQLVLSLAESLSLVEGRYLGLDVRSLPWMTQEIRQTYRQQKKLFTGTHNDDTESAALRNVTLSLMQTIDCLLLVNPDHATAWADRRRCLLRLVVKQSTKEGRCSSMFWKKELDFVNLLMTQHSKAPFSWAHRKYVLQQIMESGQDTMMTTTTTTTPVDNGGGETKRGIVSLFKDEVRVCRGVAERYPKNYYAWTHRRYFLGKVMISTSTALPTKLDLLEEEWNDVVTSWLNLHVSDHSAVHYASQVLEIWTTQLLRSSSADETSSSYLLQELATKVLSELRTLLERNESHESLWILRRMVVRILMKTRESSVEEMVREEVRSVAEAHLKRPGVENSVSPSSDVDVHALTFLAWWELVVQQDKDAIMALKDLKTWMNSDTDKGGTRSLLLSLLREHPEIYHFLWISKQ